MFNINTLHSLMFWSIVAAFTSSCNQNNKNETSADNWDKQNLRSIDVTDTAYFNAINAAQEKLDIFEALLSDRNNNNYEFFIKSKFVENDNIEHMWLVAHTLQGDSLIATLDNVPSKLKKVKYKDKLKVARTDVEDWVIYQRDSAVLGNFISNAIGK